jgi:8-amino-7-oxononanoate synthase
LPPRGRGFRLERLSGPRRPPALAEAAHEALRRGVPVGSGGSRLLRGNHPEHEALEAEAAAFFGAESALFLPTGFTANSALLATLPQAGDAIFADELIHASAHEGCACRARGARCLRIMMRRPARRPSRMAREAAAARPGSRSIALFDGWRHRPAGRPAALAEAEGAVLVVDEAHATGVLGPGGRGLVATLGARARILSLHTLGKALGPKARCWRGGGAARFLVNRARGFIFSTAPSPLAAAIARAALRLCEGRTICAPIWRAHRAGGRACWRRWAPRRMAPRSCR